MVQMSESKKPIDIITLQEWLGTNELLEQVGGIPYLAALPDTVPSAANLSYYLEILLEKFQLRRAIHTCTDLVAKVYDHEGDVDSIMDTVERDIMAIRSYKSHKPQISMKEAVKMVINKIEDYHQRQGQLIGLDTGFPDLNHMTGGLNAAEMIVLAGRPSTGKTALAINILDKVGVDQATPCGMFSMEMLIEKIVMRMVCARARVNWRNVRDGFLAERDFPKIISAAGKLSNAPIFIDDTSGLTVGQLCAKARRMKQEQDIKFLVIDYLQLLTAHLGGRRIENRNQEVGEIGLCISNLGKELGIPILTLAQLNRSVDKERRKPGIADLRESGAIEQHADIIGLLYRPKAGDDDDDTHGNNESDAGAVNLFIGKNRDGPTGDVHLTFLKAYTRFESAAKMSEEDVQTEMPLDRIPHND